MKSLKSSLQFAHAAEIAAHYAYVGHWKSIPDHFVNLPVKIEIQKIALDEIKHVYALEVMLDMVGAKPSKVKDFIGLCVGKTIGFACHIFGWNIPMKIAALMEKIGTASYYEIADLAVKETGNMDIYNQLLDMAANEEEHEKYFKEVRKNGNNN